MFNIKKWLGLDYYTSDLDKFLNEYDKQHPKRSHSQHQIVAKYKRIYQLRDHADQPTSKTSLWDKF